MQEGSWLYLLLSWCVSALAVLLTSKVIRNFHVSGFVAALGASAVIGLANWIVWPVLIFLTLPINILTLGLFTFVVNGAVLKLCAALLPGFDIEGWFAAIVGAIVLAILNAVLHYFFI